MRFTRGVGPVVLCLGLSLFAVSPVGAAQIAPSPTLLIDRHHIDATDGVRRVVTPPVKHPAPVLGPREHNFQPWTTVMRLAPNRWRLYYNALEKNRVGEDTSQAKVVSSTDGIHWQHPVSLNLPTPTWGASIIRDQGRYRYLAWDKGMWIADSQDGLRWDQPTRVGPAVSDIVSWARFNGRYVAAVKMLKGGYELGGRNADSPNTRRVVAIVTSRDGKHWTRPRETFLPDGYPGASEFYGVGGMVQRGGLLIAFLRTLRDDVPAVPGGPVDGVGETVLAWTRDGVRWHRDGMPFVPRGPVGAWDNAMAWADSHLPVGRETFVYYGGYRSGHKVRRESERQIGVARMPLDRYVTRRAAGRGVLTTTRSRFGRFLLNAKVRGSLRIEFVRRGDRRTCRVAAGNYVYRRVCRVPAGVWRARFVMRNVDLYGWQP